MMKFEAWATSENRKPLVVQGARQVGKTWLIKEFGNSHYRQVAYISFMDDENMKSVFDGSLAPSRLLEAISIATNCDAGSPDVLVVLDEVQECPRALTSLKMFCEQRPEVPLIAAGSLLGVALHQGAPYPVGKVDYLDMYPMTFVEFLLATGESGLARLVESCDFELMAGFSEKLTSALRHYYFVGGMPEAVAAFGKGANFDAARIVQLRLLRDYEHDFSKYASPELTEKIRLVWRSAPSQLARENKKFIYSAVRSGARARGYEEAIQWLVDAGLLLKVSRITKPGLPLLGYEDKDAFKLYLLDVGLLGAASSLDKSTLIEGSGLFTEFKGALTENYVCQALYATRVIRPYYWSADKSTGEVDFVYDFKNTIVPVEVKVEENLKAKSLRSFVESNCLNCGVRLSLSGYREQSWMVNIPLYSANALPEKAYKIMVSQTQANPTR